jgi:nucleotide-binding universal stress UspA family protein
MRRRTYLESSVGRVGTGPVQTVLRVGDPATEISAVAKDYSAAAVVMATHGRTGLARSLLGSVAGGVLHKCQCPVVLVRPPRLRAAEQPVGQRATSASPV